MVEIMRSKDGHLFIEFSFTVFVLFIMCLFPLLDLITTAAAAASLLLLTHETVNAAAVQQDFDGSLSAAVKTANTFLDSQLGRFLKLQAKGGYKESGVNLYVTVTNFHTGKTETIGPNVAPLDLPDELENIYEYTVQCICNVGPVVSMDSLPVLKDVPGLGKPATLKFTACRAIEHLHKSKQSVNGSTTSISLGGATNGSVPSAGKTDPTGGDWNDPIIYQDIARAGQTVVANDVLIVDANNENWTVSKAYAAAGEKIWIDTRVDGSWSGSSVNQPFDANGYSPPMINQMPAGALEGRLGDSGTPYMSGTSKLNFVPPVGSGYVQFRFNDDPGMFYMNRGSMIVRVIVTR